jgi:hypothetical protein
MRKLSFVFAAAVLFTAGNLFANDFITTDPSKNLATQIGELLDDNYFIIENQDLTANVIFTLNHDREIVVISVDTDNEVLEKFVKTRLNYHEVNVDNFKEGKLYTVPVRITE